MHSGILEEYAPPEMKMSMVDFICFKRTRSCLQELRLLLGQHVLIDILNKLAGTYILLPSTKDLTKLQYDYLAALTVQRIKKAKKDKDLSLWNQEEMNLQRIAKKTKRTYRYTYLRGITVLREAERVLEWKRKLETWGKKYLVK